MSAENFLDRVKHTAIKVSYQRGKNPVEIRAIDPKTLFDQALEIPWDSTNRRGTSYEAIITTAAHLVLGKDQLEKFYNRIVRRQELLEQVPNGNGRSALET